jgi:hypothetical protein
MPDQCDWKMEENWDDSCWHTSCGRYFCFTEEGGPKEHAFHFCPGCGKPLNPIVPQPEPDDAE